MNNDLIMDTKLEVDSAKHRRHPNNFYTMIITGLDFAAYSIHSHHVGTIYVPNWVP